MLLRFRINRPSNVMKGLREKLLPQAWAAPAKAHRTLADNLAPPDTFAGRKTQEPFPREEDL